VTNKLPHPMDWWNNKQKSLIRGEVDDRFCGLEIWCDGIKNTKLRFVVGILLFFLLELPLFGFYMLCEFVFHPVDFFVEIYDGCKEIKKLNKENEKMEKYLKEHNKENKDVSSNML
jgi:hypothetical protein